MREMSEPTLDEIVENFDSQDGDETGGPKMYTTLTIWVPVETKALYNKVQQRSRRSRRPLSSMLRDLVNAAVKKADEKAS